MKFLNLRGKKKVEITAELRGKWVSVSLRDLVFDQERVQGIHERLLFEVNPVGEVLQDLGHQHQTPVTLLLGEGGEQVVGGRGHDGGADEPEEEEAGHHKVARLGELFDSQALEIVANLLELGGAAVILSNNGKK